MHILSQITARLRVELERKKQRLPLEKLRQAAAARPLPPSFAGALKNGRHAATPRVIAELKKASPSAGLIRENFKPARLARSLENAGAAALSILTEPNFFLGKLAYLERAAARAKIPLLRKDFVFDEYQICEARAAGASAVLLIARMLDDRALANFLETCRRLRLDALCEIHDARELGRALDAGASIIGVNCRDLGNFTLDISLSEKLLAKIPRGKIAVAESGLSTAAELRRLQTLGADAFLVGTALMKAPRPSAALASLLKNEPGKPTP